MSRFKKKLISLIFKKKEIDKKIEQACKNNELYNGIIYEDWNAGALNDKEHTSFRELLDTKGSLYSQISKLTKEIKEIQNQNFISNKKRKLN